MQKILSILSSLTILFALCCVPISASAQTGSVTVSGSNIVDSTGTPVANGTIYFAPVNASGFPISYRYSGKGQAITTAAQANVTNGAFSLTLPDTSMTSPQNVCFSVTVIDNVSGNRLLGSGYSCVQPAYNTTTPNNWCVNGACNFDNYQPNLAGLIISQLGPVGPAPNLAIGTVTVNPNATATASVTGTNPNYRLNIGLPLAPSATDTTKLPLSGGTLTGTLNSSMTDLSTTAGDTLQGIIGSINPSGLPHAEVGVIADSVTNSSPNSVAFDVFPHGLSQWGIGLAIEDMSAATAIDIGRSTAHSTSMPITFESGANNSVGLWGNYTTLVVGGSLTANGGIQTVDTNPVSSTTGYISPIIALAPNATAVGNTIQIAVGNNCAVAPGCASMQFYQGADNNHTSAQFGLSRSNGGVISIFPSGDTQINSVAVDQGSTFYVNGSTYLNGILTLNGAVTANQNITANGNITVSGSNGSFNAVSAPSFYANTRIQVVPVNTATASANYNSALIELEGSYWNGTAAVNEGWYLTAGIGTGTNPTDTIFLTHNGPSTGALLFDIGTNLKVDGTTTLNAVTASSMSTTTSVSSPAFTATTSITTPKLTATGSISTPVLNTTLLATQGNGWTGAPYINLDVTSFTSSTAPSISSGTITCPGDGTHNGCSILASDLYGSTIIQQVPSTGIAANTLAVTSVGSSSSTWLNVGGSTQGANDIIANSTSTGTLFAVQASGTPVWTVGQAGGTYNGTGTNPFTVKASGTTLLSLNTTGNIINSTSGNPLVIQANGTPVLTVPSAGGLTGSNWSISSGGTLTAGAVKALTVSAPGGTLSGCSLTGASGTQTAGSFTSGTTGTCTVTMAVGYVVAHGYACWATDQTSGVTLPQTASTTSSCTFAGNTTTGDIIVYGITGY